MKKLIKRLLFKASLLILILVFLFMPFSQSFLFDLELSSGNTFAAGTLDFTAISETNNFTPNPDQVAPGDSVSRTASINNIGSLDMIYQGKYDYLAGNPDLCQGLHLTITANTIDVIYNGPLSAFNSFIANQTLLSSGIDMLEFDLQFPVDAGDELSEQFCTFDLQFIGWADGSDGMVQTGFWDKEILTGNVITTLDYVLPAAPTGLHILDHENNDLGCGGATNNRAITIDWDDNTEPDLDYYNYYIKDNHNPLQTLTISELTGNIRDQDGEYRYCVEAVDDAGNFEHICEMDGLYNPLYPQYWCSVTLDRSAPNTSLFTSNSPLREITNQVINGSFEQETDGLPDDWDVSGDVEVMLGDIGGTVVPVEGDKMVRIGLNDEFSFGNDLKMNYLSQDIPNTSKNLSFWYYFHTYDGQGYDQPGFAVFLNDQMVYQLWAADVEDDDFDYPNHSGGWRHFYYDLSEFDMSEDPILTLVFYAGDTPEDDATWPSWVYLDGVSTGQLTVNSNTKIYLQANDSLTSPTAYYQLGPCDEPGLEVYEYDPLDDGFSLSDSTINNRFCFWGEDEVGNQEVKKEIEIIFDDQPPDTVDDLTAATVNEEGDIELTWTAPNDEGNGQAAAYDLRYSTATISAAVDWDSLLLVSDLEVVYGDGQDMPSPRPSGADESLLVLGSNLEIEPGVQYWFALKSSDAAPNWSEMSSVVDTGSSVVINEVYYDVDATHGTENKNEWIELYNSSDIAVSLKNWSLVDSAGTVKTINPEVSIPAHGFAVLSHDNSTWTTYWTLPAEAVTIQLTGAQAWLNNDGDKLTLKNSLGNEVDFVAWEHHVLGWDLDASEGESIARKTKGVDTNLVVDWEVLEIPNPGTNPHSFIAPPELLMGTGLGPDDGLLGSVGSKEEADDKPLDEEDNSEDEEENESEPKEVLPPEEDPPVVSSTPTPTPTPEEEEKTNNNQDGNNQEKENNEAVEPEENEEI